MPIKKIKLLVEALRGMKEKDVGKVLDNLHVLTAKQSRGIEGNKPWRFIPRLKTGLNELDVVWKHQDRIGVMDHIAKLALQRNLTGTIDILSLERFIGSIFHHDYHLVPGSTLEIPAYQHLPDDTPGALLMARCAFEAYEEKPHVNGWVLRASIRGNHHVPVFIFARGTTRIVSFRGTKSTHDLKDGMLGTFRYLVDSTHSHETIVHGMEKNSRNCFERIRGPLLEILEKDTAKTHVFFTGHSLGAGLAADFVQFDKSFYGVGFNSYKDSEDDARFKGFFVEGDVVSALVEKNPLRHCVWKINTSLTLVAALWVRHSIDCHLRAIQKIQSSGRM